MNDFLGPGARATKLLILANAVVFALGAIFGAAAMDPVQRIFGLSRAGLADGWWWQLVTHQFLHGNGVHLFVNMIMLWFVGRDTEDVMGTTAYLMLYFGGGIVGGLSQLPALGSSGVLIGASGSVCAVFLALMTLFPRVPVTALLFFVLPVRMKAGALAITVVVGSILLWISGLAPNVGHAAHLGGFAYGFLFAVGFRIHKHRESQLLPGVVQPDWNESYDDALPAATTRRAVVEKLLRHGLESLTRAERDILESSRPKRETRRNL